MRLSSYPWVGGSLSSPPSPPDLAQVRFRRPPGLDCSNSLVPGPLLPTAGLAGHQSTIPTEDQDPITAPGLKPILQRQLASLEACLTHRAPHLCTGCSLR